MSMKTIRLIGLSILAFSLAGNLLSQTANEIISKYIQVIGGKDRLSKITSIYTESTIEAMGAQGIIKSTTLNWKGMRTDIEIGGFNIISCYTEKEGWSINTMIGNSSAEIMPPAQYNLGKDQIIIGGPFINYAEKGYKVELLGTDTVANVNSYKIKFTSPDSILSIYFFDTKTFYLVKAVSQTVAVGQIVESITNYSDFRQTDGYTIPYKTELYLAGGQYVNEMTVTKVELNRPVDELIFKKPE
jgi:hypothetical protein